MDYKIEIPDFEGPLDLLLHLIKKSNIDIYNICKQIHSPKKNANKYVDPTGDKFFAQSNRLFLCFNHQRSYVFKQPFHDISPDLYLAFFNIRLLLL